MGDPMGVAATGGDGAPVDVPPHRRLCLRRSRGAGSHRPDRSSWAVRWGRAGLGLRGAVEAVVDLLLSGASALSTAKRNRSQHGNGTREPNG